MDGDKQLGISRIRFHLAAQPPGSTRRWCDRWAIAAMADEGEDPLPTERPPGMGDKGHQHFIFGLGQAHRHSVLAELTTGMSKRQGPKRTASSATAGSLGAAAASEIRHSRFLTRTSNSRSSNGLVT